MVFVTGGTGLVGARLIYDLLRNGNVVRALHRPDSDMRLVERILSFYHGSDITELLSKLNWVSGDILDVDSLRDGMKGCDRVYHAAAVVSFHPKDAMMMYRVNVHGTANVVDCCLEEGVKRLCHISSVAAIGRSESGVLVHEGAKWEVNEHTSQYALSKYGAEMEVWRGSQEGLPATIVNPVLVLGPTDPTDSSGQLFGVVRKGLNFYGPGTSSYIDVKDVSSTAIRLMELAGGTERFILSAETWESLDFFTALANEFEVKPPGTKLKKWMAEMAWRFFAIRDMLTNTKSEVTKETARSAFTRFDYDSTKVKERLNIQFTPIRQSISTYAPFYR